MCALWQTLTTQKEKDGLCPPWVPNLETCKQLNKYKYYLRDMDTTKPNARNLDLCIKLSEKASRRRCRCCWYLTHNDTYTSIFSWHFPVKFLHIFWGSFTWIWNTERTALAFSHNHFSQFHAALSVDSKWGLWMLWAGFSCCVDFDEIDFTVFYTPFIFGYTCISLVLFLHLMVSNMICHSRPDVVRSSSYASRPFGLGNGSHRVVPKPAALALPGTLTTNMSSSPLTQIYLIGTSSGGLLESVIIKLF